MTPPDLTTGTYSPGQGAYHNPMMYDMGKEVHYEGYTTDIITDLALDWLKDRDKNRPFMLMYHHKAPHRPWEPDDKHADMYEDIDIPEPETLWDDYSNRATAASQAEMRVNRDLNPRDLKQPVPEGLTPEEDMKWKYQRYIKDYLRCVASVDDNVGRVLDYLDEEGTNRQHHRRLYIGPGLLPGRPRLVRQTIYVRRIPPHAIPHPVSQKKSKREVSATT